MDKPLSGYTDRELLEEVFRRNNIEIEKLPAGPYGCLTGGKVSGYRGFYVAILFGRQGELKEIGAWE